MKAICKNAHAYHFLTEGKTYEIVKIEPEFHEKTFTYPAYAIVIGDDGQKLTAHAHRFENENGIRLNKLPQACNSVS